MPDQILLHLCVGIHRVLDQWNPKLTLSKPSCLSTNYIQSEFSPSSRNWWRINIECPHFSLRDVMDIDSIIEAYNAGFKVLSIGQVKKLTSSAPLRVLLESS